MWIPLTVLIAAISVYVAVLPRLLSALIGLPLPAKLAVSAAILGPLGFAMGMPFPTGLRALVSSAQPELPASEFGEPVEIEDNGVEWAWAMNAASSVLGSVLAMVIAIRFGLNVTLACGAAAYLLALLLTPTLSPRRV